MKFSPANTHGSSRTGTIQNITVDEIIEIFGFGPNVDDDPYKVVHSWCVEVTDNLGWAKTVVHVWDFKGSHMFNQFSCDGDPYTLKAIFGDRYVMESWAT